MHKTVNALIDNAHIRWSALQELWMHRSYWRLAEPRRIMREFRNQKLTEMMPFFILISAMAGGTIFVLIPSVLPEQAHALTGIVWPVWVASIAPMVCAQTMALLIAPSLALELIHMHNTDALKEINTVYGAPAGNPCISWIVALSAVCVIASYLLIAFSLFIGLGLALMFHVGDVRATLDAVLLSANPIKWLRSGAAAAILGAVAGVSVVLYAWPGTHPRDPSSEGLLKAHKIALRVMLVCSIAVALSGSSVNWIAALFDPIE